MDGAPTTIERDLAGAKSFAVLTLSTTAMVNLEVFRLVFSPFQKDSNTDSIFLIQLWLPLFCEFGL